MREFRLPRLAYNWISALGVIIAVVSLLTMAFLYVLGGFARDTNPYLGIFLYLVIPVFLIIGLLLIPIGMLLQWWRMKKTGQERYPEWPAIDFNRKEHRNAAFIFIVGTALFLIISSVGSYKAYHFTESVTFCGKVCHTIMKPEYTAYHNSPHARVSCVDCHIGPGADWYAKSKLSGLYQVYATITHKYPRPIPTPIKNLRPARETCEQCHWPQKFYGSQQRIFDHYMYNKENSHWPINLLVKTGGGDPETGKVSGIHWHMFIDSKVEYIAGDKRRQTIPWVKITDLKTDRVVIYQDTDDPLFEEEIKKAEPRILDCMDCHDRPSHIYNPPDHAVDMALQIGQINKALPEIKRVAVKALAAEYETEQAAVEGIAKEMDFFYEKNYPELHKTMNKDIIAAILTVQRIYSQNVFPFMKVSWRDYPDNIGHFYNNGCFRCHDGKHVSEEGLIVSTECSTCHTILSQGSGGRASWASSDEGLEFDHPEDIGEAWKEMGCHECHTGTQP